jgi:hypothetical protein
LLKSIPLNRSISTKIFQLNAGRRNGPIELELTATKDVAAVQGYYVRSVKRLECLINDEDR